MNNRYGLESLDEHDQVDGYFNTYEEAENLLIDKLIELVKQQSNTDDTLSKQQDK